MKSILLSMLFAFTANIAHALPTDQYNFKFSPIGALVGVINADLDIKINPNWTLGPTVYFWNYKLSSSSNSTTLSDYEVRAFGLGARGNWYKNGVYTDGLYVGPSLTYNSVEVTTTGIFGTKYSGKATPIIVNCLVGYGWFWDSFNMQLGGGLSLGSGSIKVTSSDGYSYEEVNYSRGALAIEYSLGWTF